MATVNNIGLTAEVTPTDYDFGKFINVMETDVIVLANKTSQRMAFAYRDRVIRAIKNQEHPLVPLTVKYAKHKASAGLDPRILISTGKLVSHIKAWRWRRGKQETFIVGIPPRAMYTRKSKKGHTGGTDKAASTRTPVVDVARWLEHGTSKMPARPVWFLTFSELLSDMKTFSDWYRRQVNKTMRAKLTRQKKIRKTTRAKV